MSIQFLLKGVVSLSLAFILFCNQLVLPTLTLSPQGFFFAFKESSGVAYAEETEAPPIPTVTAQPAIPKAEATDPAVCDTIDPKYKDDCKAYSTQDGNVFTYGGNADELGLGNAKTAASLWIVYIMELLTVMLTMFIIIGCPQLNIVTFSAAAFLVAGVMPVVADIAIHSKIKKKLGDLKKTIQFQASQGNTIDQVKPLLSYKEALSSIKKLVAQRKSVYYASMGFYILAAVIPVAELAIIYATLNIARPKFTEVTGCVGASGIVKGVVIGISTVACIGISVGGAVNFDFFGLTGITPPMPIPMPKAATPMCLAEKKKTKSDEYSGEKMKRQLFTMVSGLLNVITNGTLNSKAQEIANLLGMPNAWGNAEATPSPVDPKKVDKGKEELEGVKVSNEPIKGTKNDSLGMSKLFSGLGIGIGITLCVILALMATFVDYFSLNYMNPETRIIIGTICAVVMGVAAGVLVQDLIDRLDKRIKVLDVVIEQLQKKPEVLPTSSGAVAGVGQTDESAIHAGATTPAEERHYSLTSLGDSLTTSITDAFPQETTEGLIRATCGSNSSSTTPCLGTDGVAPTLNGHNAAFSGSGLAELSNYVREQGNAFSNGTATSATTGGILNNALKGVNDYKKRLSDLQKKDQGKKKIADPFKTGQEGAKRFFSDAQKSFKRIMDKLGADAINKEAAMLGPGGMGGGAADSEMDKLLKNQKKEGGSGETTTVKSANQDGAMSGANGMNEGGFDSMSGSNLLNDGQNAAGFAAGTGTEKLTTEQELKKYNTSNKDIHGASGPPLWEIITGRYKKTAYPIFFKRK
ncbi:MAG: hypothetical protein HQK50_00665 [Oligoflexia bacterium]|nr:hypothetical protein [Oligoflexia bacterium]